MKAKGWKKIIIQANTDKKQMKLLAKLLEETDKTKQALRAKGYGWTGLSLLETVEQVEHNEEISYGDVMGLEEGLLAMENALDSSKNMFLQVKRNTI